MSYEIISNKKDRSITLRISSNSIIEVAGMSPASEIAIGDEEINGVSIRQIFWGCAPSEHIQIFRGSTLIGVFDSTSYIDFAGNGIPLTLLPSSSLNVTFSGSNSYCLIELRKLINTTSDIGTPEQFYLTINGEPLTINSDFLTLGA